MNDFQWHKHTSKKTKKMYIVTQEVGNQKNKEQRIKCEQSENIGAVKFRIKSSEEKTNSGLIDFHTMRMLQHMIS